MVQKKFERLFPDELLKLGRRHRELARIMIRNPEYTKTDLRRESKYSKTQMNNILASRVFKEHLAHLSNKRDEKVVSRRAVIAPGALQAVKRLIAIVTPGTEENKHATVSNMIEAARELLDRDGSVPKVKHLDTTSRLSQGLTTEELNQLTGTRGK